MTQRFHLGDILSVTTSALVSPEGLDGVARILDYLTGERLETPQLPEAGSRMKPVLIAQFPALARVTAPSFADERQADAWLAELTLTFGEWHEVHPA